MTGKRVLVCGGRDYKDRYYLAETLSGQLSMTGIECIIHGAARGADSLADQWAESRGVSVKRFPAQWSKYGLRAGHIRNTQMLVEGKPDIVIAFPGGKGTRNMVKQAQDAGVEVVRAGWIDSDG